MWYAVQVVEIHYVIQVLVLVTAILYAACHASLVLRDDPNASNPDTSTHSTESSKEVLRKEDAMQFPIVGSISLFSLYLAFKFLDKDMVNLLISAYFAVIGTLALTMTISPFLGRLLPSQPFLRHMGWDWKVSHPLPEFLAGPSPADLSADFTLVDVIALLGAAGVCTLYFQSKLWYLNNILGIAFCLQGIERFSLGTYKIGAILLIGLFFYDIFWVFGTDVMVTVAKNLDGPIKILFPRSLEANPETGKLDLSLLGLGDIVIPGFFLALLLRFDAHQAQQPVTDINVHAAFAKPYFISALVAYVLGLATTLFVMIQFKAAQPALLYLVPACLGSSSLCAIARGEWNELLDYSEEEDEDDEPQALEASAKKDN